MIGSLLVMEFESREQLDEYLASEPYVVEQVWERIEVERMNVVILDKEIIKERVGERSSSTSEAAKPSAGIQLQQETL